MGCVPAITRTTRGVPSGSLARFRGVRKVSLTKSRDPEGCTYQSSDPEGCTYQSRDPEGCTYQSSDPEGSTYQSSDPEGCTEGYTYQSRDPKGCTYQSSIPVGYTYQSSDPEGCTYQSVSSVGIYMSNPHFIVTFPKFSLIVKSPLCKSPSRRLQDQRSTTVEASPAASWRTMKLYFNATDGQTKGDARRFWDEGDEGGGVDGRPTAAETTDSLAFVQSCRCRKVAACANDGGREETLKWTGEDGSAVG
ncbi:NBS-LRR type resistance protein [Cucumis melo var. makuwa]|uniref:NBS-LRR type resistance protein n=1 Tax=Cucumis melo var. makuwa TaxID=1194695 RepID=A0A5A7VJB1_CUCMM|nr:NBS-LRR type resistance protein [Cucumis melo var. makuwa]